MAEVVRLSVHRNTLEKRRIGKIRRAMMNEVRSMSRDFPVAGYAVVMWNRKNDYRASWDLGTNRNIPGNVMPEFVKVSLIRELLNSDTRSEIDRQFGQLPDDSA